jgi:predicted metal-dependent enzyme (double-stranded beta helix superfamily)
MCDFHVHDHGLEPLDHDEWVLDTPTVRAFIAGVEAEIAAAPSAEDACAAIEPSFRALLADRDWLPAVYQDSAAESGMGGGIGQWLLYRSRDRSLCLFSLVVPAGSMTPIHDHLAWGLIGLYRGGQDEEIYRPGDGTMETLVQRPVAVGDCYRLLPPANDVHRVRTTSDTTSVSIHLLANDTGCVARHTYDEATGAARPFRSGYVNADCEEGPLVAAEDRVH